MNPEALDDPRVWLLGGAALVLGGLLAALFFGMRSYLRGQGAPVDYPRVTLRQYAKRWARNALYLAITVSVTVATSMAYLRLLQSVEWNRSQTFITSWALMLVVFAAGCILEDRLLWKGFFYLPAGQDRLISRSSGKRGPQIDLAPPPITFGLVLGLLSFQWLT